jgi:hypothetical protein
MKTLALVLVSTLALADTPDAARVMSAGSVLPDDAVCLTPSAAVAAAKRITACEAERVELRKDVWPSWVPIVLGVVVFGAGVGVGVTLPRR